MLWKMITDLVLIFLISYVNSSVPSTTPLTTQTTEVYKRLMLLSAGSGSYFNQTWQLYSYKDPHGNKSDGSIEELVLGGEFKAFINPAWGEAQWVLIDYLNGLGDIIGQVQFYVPGYNITAQTTWMLSAFDQILPLSITWSEASVFDRIGDKEVLVGNTSTDNAWMSILHATTGSNPEFVIVSNVSQPFITGSTSSINSMGCKPVTTVTINFKASDASDMTVESCFSLCSGSLYLYVGLKYGTECYCVNITISNLYDDLPQYCTFNCSGNSAQICGGSTTAYISVYNVTSTSDYLDSLIDSKNTTLLTVIHDGYTTEITIDVTTQNTWPDDYMYVTGIKVTGENSTGQAVKFHIEHKYNQKDTYLVYKTSINGTSWIGLTGIIYELEPLLLRELKVVFKDETTNILVDMIGPTGTPSSPGYITADFLLVSAIYSPVTTTTSTTMSTTTTAVSNVTSPGTTPNTTIVLNTTASTTRPTVTNMTVPSTTPNVTSSTTTSATSNSPTTITTLSTTTQITNSTSTSSSNTPTTSGSVLPSTSPTTTPTTMSTTSTSTTSTATSNSPTAVVTTTNSPSTTVTTTPITVTSTFPPTTNPPSTASTLVTTTLSSTFTTTALVTTTSLSATTVVYSNYSILVNGVVYCPCSLLVTQNTTNSTVDIDAIIAELTLDENTLSSNTRKYNSADDTRPSARTLGALGVIVITVVVASIVAMDSATLISEAKKIKKNYRYLKKQLSRRSLKVDDISTINNTDQKSDNLPEVLS